MWKKRAVRTSTPQGLGTDLWNEIIERENVGLLIDGCKFKSDTNHISREYFGRLFFQAPHPAAGLRVSLNFETALQEWPDGRVQWWHWGTNLIPRENVYGYAFAVQQSHPPKIQVCLGTDIEGELLFEKLFERAELMKSGPIPIHIWMKPLPKIQDSEYATVVVSRFIIEQLMNIEPNR